MIKVSIFSSLYWKALFSDLKGVLKGYPIQVMFSLIFAVGMAAGLVYEGQVVFGLVFSICYFLGTNMLLMIVSEKIEHGFAQNTVTAYVLFGTSTDKLKMSYLFWVAKILVVAIKFSCSPILLIVCLFQYQNVLNKIIAKEQLEN